MTCNGITNSTPPKHNAGLMFGAISALAVAAITPTQEAESSGEYDAIFDPEMNDFRLIRHK